MDHVDPQGRIIKIDETLVKRELGEIVKDTVEETLNKMLVSSPMINCRN